MPSILPQLTASIVYYDPTSSGLGVYSTQEAIDALAGGEASQTLQDAYVDSGPNPTIDLTLGPLLLIGPTGDPGQSEFHVRDHTQSYTYLECKNNAAGFNPSFGACSYAPNFLGGMSLGYANTYTSGTHHVLLGSANDITGGENSLVGMGGSAAGSNLICLGGVCNGDEDVSIGLNSASNGVRDVTIGSGAECSADDGVAIGSNARAALDGNVGVGLNSQADGLKDVVVGANSSSGSGGNNVVVGTGNVNIGDSCVLLGALIDNASDNVGVINITGAALSVPVGQDDTQIVAGTSTMLIRGTNFPGTAVTSANSISKVYKIQISPGLNANVINEIIPLNSACQFDYTVSFAQPSLLGIFSGVQIGQIIGSYDSVRGWIADRDTILDNFSDITPGDITITNPTGTPGIMELNVGVAPGASSAYWVYVRFNYTIYTMS